MQLVLMIYVFHSRNMDGTRSSSKALHAIDMFIEIIKTHDRNRSFTQSKQKNNMWPPNHTPTKRLVHPSSASVVVSHHQSNVNINVNSLILCKSVCIHPGYRLVTRASSGYAEKSKPDREVSAPVVCTFLETHGQPLPFLGSRAEARSGFLALRWLIVGLNLPRLLSLRGMHNGRLHICLATRIACICHVQVLGGSACSTLPS